MAYLQSSQNFVRALKAPNDPPNADSPAKIDIAREVWKNETVNIQNKAETIIEFILTRLLKEKAKTAHCPITDRRYWDLLSSVLGSLSPSSFSAASTKAWLLPLLNRLPLVPICTSLLEQSTTIDPESAVLLMNASSSAIAAMWPLASPKFTADILLECFGALLSAAAYLRSDSPGLFKLGTLVSSSLLEAFTNSSNKKRLHQIFTQAQLQRWVICIANFNGEDLASALNTEIHRTGREILFNVDTLKSLSEPSSLTALFATLPVTEASLQALSKLLQSFTVASRKNRTLFGQGTSAPTAARAVAMLFFAHCTEYVRSAPSELFGAAYAARLALLRVIEEEALLGFGQAEGQQAIRKEVTLCISALPLDSPVTADSSLLLDSLCVVSRIDHDLLEPHLPELLPHLLVIPASPHPAALSATELLTLCISYHSRARSLPSLLAQVQTVFASLTPAQMSVREMYSHAAGSPLLAQSFLASFAKAVQTFITPGQVFPTAQDIVTSLEHAYEKFASLGAQSAGDRGLGPRKKARKSRASTDGHPASDTSGVDGAALHFALLARLAACILPTLPIQTVTADVQGEVRECIRRADFAKDDLLRPETHDGEDRRMDPWAAHTVLAAALRLVYALQASPRLQFPALHPDRKHRVVEVHQRSSVLPELFLETSRYLMRTFGSEETGENSAILDRILVFLERHLKLQQAWNGRSAELVYGDDGASQAATGLLRLVLDRFIFVFNGIASQDQLDRLTELLSKAAASSYGASDALTPGMVAKECLRSAQLWEQRRLRTSLLTSITTRLQSIENINIEAVANGGPHSLPLSSFGLKSDTLNRISEGFHLLLYFPAEYLSKPSRVDILRRAVVLDMALASVAPVEDPNRTVLKVVRTFLQRTFRALGSAEHQYAQAYLNSLVQSVSANGADDKATLEIIDAHVRTIFRIAQRHPVDAASNHIASLLPLPPKQSSPVVDERMDMLRERLMSVLTRDFTIDSFPAELKEALCTLQERMTARITALAGTFATADGALLHERVVAIASAYLRFSSWLGVRLGAPPFKATELVRALVSSNSASLHQRQSESVFGLLIAEFECEVQEREGYLAELLASYVVLSQKNASFENKYLDVLLLGATRRFSIGEFAVSLDLVAQMLCDEQSAHRLSWTVHLGSMLLRGAPEGTLKTTQAFFTRTLCTFVDYPHFISHHQLRTQTLELLEQQCCERPASLRLINLTTMWPLLARMLAGASTRDERTSPATFHKIVSIVGALVRLRRDLVVNTLPHLSIVLRMLINSLRGPRPNLGGKQINAVAHSLPAWIDPNHPLVAEEGRALARLMTTLATKTVVRLHTSSSESQKADSLARPLSKHVAYVIQAYVNAVNDPLCVVPLAVRQELMPGLFVLCEMLNEHDRDALMVSGLDAAGKATLKALWRDYEKQRYVGKG